MYYKLKILLWFDDAIFNLAIKTVKDWTFTIKVFKNIFFY